MTVPQDLIERVRKATGPNRHLDALIEVEARRQDAYRVGMNDEQRAKWEAGIGGVVTDGHTAYLAYTFTASIDAALALAERVLPGWVCEHIGQDAVGRLGEMKGIGWTAEFSNGLDTYQGQAPTLPLAIVIATLLALQSSEQSK